MPPRKPCHATVNRKLPVPHPLCQYLSLLLVDRKAAVRLAVTHVTYLVPCPILRHPEYFLSINSYC